MTNQRHFQRHRIEANLTFWQRLMAAGLIVLAAEFDIEKGSSVSFIYPENSPKTDEHPLLAEWMLPGSIQSLVKPRSSDALFLLYRGVSFAY
jgi:hypothetical protein